MLLYLDCEYNGFGGDLISIALVPQFENIASFYKVLEYDEDQLIPWVKDNVIPKLKESPESKDQVQKDFFKYLHQFNRVHVIADWPEDLIHFNKLLLTEPGKSGLSQKTKVSMELIRIDSISKLPHNALADAEGLRQALDEPKLLAKLD